MFARRPGGSSVGPSTLVPVSAARGVIWVLWKMLMPGPHPATLTEGVWVLSGRWDSLKTASDPNVPLRQRAPRPGRHRESGSEDPAGVPARSGRVGPWPGSVIKADRAGAAALDGSPYAGQVAPEEDVVLH